MNQTVTVNVKRLKDQLSAYLREVKAGNTALITEREIVIAELRKPSTHLGMRSNAVSTFIERVQVGALIPLKRTKKPLPNAPVALRKGTAQRVLDRDRVE